MKKSLRKVYRKSLSAALALLVMSVFTGGCGGQTANGNMPGNDTQQGSGVTAQTSADEAGSGTEAQTDDEGALQVVTTIFPVYEWVRNVVGTSGGAEVRMLLDSGVDLHSFQPTAADILEISTCDVFVYVGGESDEWVTDALKEAVNPDMRVVNLLDALGDAAMEEELLPGMQEDAHAHDGEAHTEEEHDANDTHTEEVHAAEQQTETADTEKDHAEEEHGTEEVHEEETHTEEAHTEEAHAAENGGEHAHEESERDEHVWLSLKNAETLVRVIAKTLAEAAPQYAAAYEQNAETYVEALQALDAKYTEMISSAARKTLLFGDRYPFAYLAADYDLTCYAAFAGCSAETEASFETIVFLAGKTDELQLPCVLMIEGGDGKIAQTIVQSTSAKSQRVLTLDSMQSVTAKDVDDGATYLSLMEKNLEVLREALN